jgi:tRNA-2-methylthio-N6-dimethylallyladenosine synthase
MGVETIMAQLKLDMPRYYIWTIGCQMNKADSERIGTHLERWGCHPSQSIEDADLVILNSCVVRQSAEDRVLGRVASLKSLKRTRPGVTIALTGCIVSSHLNDLRKRLPHVDLFFPPGELQPLYQWAESRGLSTSHESELLPTHPPISSFVTVIRGCDNFCTYCIVPYCRGRERSRSLEEIVHQVRELVKRGSREVILLGQNVDSYGHDLPSKPDLADLLMELQSIEGLTRIRFLTSHPKDISQKLINTLARLDKVCEQISLPVQSGDDDILKAMRRGYTVDYYRHLVEQVRSAIPGVALSTDVIVGFPGETQHQFQRMDDLLSELKFDTVHVAAYSPRPGTFASRHFKDDVPLEEKKRRCQRIEELQKDISAEINSQLQGKAVEVLVEGEKGGKRWGRTRTDKLVFFEDSIIQPGQLVSIKVEKTSPWALQGKIE